MPAPREHPHPDDLALLALGERVEGVDIAHLEGCRACRGEVDALGAVVAAARSLTPQDSPQAPPARVWDAVRAELGVSPRAARGGPARRTSMRLAAAAAVAGLLVGSVATGLIVAANDDGTAGRVLARTRLAALPERSGSGDAELLGSGTGRVLEVDVRGLTRGDGFYEVWLLGAEGTRLVSLGLLDGTTARFPIPPEVDVADYPVVDVSLEPADGNPAHSGDSIVRGSLRG